jgi:hypothetical protein
LTSSTFCVDDPKFLNFIAQEAFQNRPFKDSAKELAPIFVPTELFNDESLQHRQEIIKTLA